jgi:NAD(P)H-hydrate epimerase
MKVVTAEQMQQMDSEAIRKFGIPGLDLMERAGEGCAAAIIDACQDADNCSAMIVCGKGNNGGDGYVVARLLRARGWGVTVVILARSEEIAGDAAVNLKRLPAGIPIHFCADEESLGRCLSESGDFSVIVDALLGTGLKQEVAGLYLQAIKLINNAGCPVIAVDIPSGISGSSGKVLGNAVRADLTVTFASAKLGHILYPGAGHVGRLKIVDIGIPGEIIERAVGAEFVDASAAAKLIQQRDPSAHKGSFGHILIIAGSTGHTGAAALAASGAVRSGAGLVSLAIPASLNQILEQKTTEAMTLPLPDCARGYLASDALDPIRSALHGRDVVAIGPGISRQRETSDLVRQLVREVKLPLVIDADGLNALSEYTSLFTESISPAIVLTPHPGEMARLCGVTVAAVEADRVGVACDFAVNHGVFLVLKGARTVIAAPDGAVAINGSGNPGMASGGMGDVLTGIIAALLGQHYSPFDACRLGVFVHGLAADLSAAEKGMIGLIASDVVERLPNAFKKLLEL